MKNKIKKNYSAIRKFILAFAVTLVILFGYNFVLEYKESKNSNKINNDDKLLLVKYTLVDKNEIPEGSSIDDLWASHFDALYNIVMDNVVLQEEEDYYVADLSYTNDIITNDISDVDFAMNNDLGEVIDDCKFDKENLKIYIPKKYYKEDRIPVQTQIMSRIDSDQITVNYKKGNTKRTISSDVYDNKLKIPIVNNEVAGHKLNSNDITVYINGKKYYLDKSNSIYYKNGSLDISYNAALIDNIEVKIDRKNIFRKAAEKIFAATVVKASGVHNVDFSNYSSLGNLRKSEITKNLSGLNRPMQEDDVWYLSGNENTYRARVILDMSRYLTNCRDWANDFSSESDRQEQFLGCAQNPFDMYLLRSGGREAGSGLGPDYTQHEGDINYSNLNDLSSAYDYCNRYGSTIQLIGMNLNGELTRACNSYYDRVFTCMKSGKTKEKCKQYAYFQGSETTANYDRLGKALEGFSHSFTKLIYKLEGTASTENENYTNYLYWYVIRNNSTYPNSTILGTDLQFNVMQWIRLPQAGASAMSITDKDGSTIQSTTSSFPLTVYYSMKDYDMNEYDSYVGAACGHINASAWNDRLPTTGNNQVALGVKVAKKTDDYVILAFATHPGAAGAGTEQATYALYKFDIFDDTKNKLKVTKQYRGDSSDTVTGNETFKVYEATKSGNDWICSNQVGDKLSYSSGAFYKNSGLINDKPYCLIEDVDNKDFSVEYFNNNTNVTSNVKLNGNTVKGTIINFDSNGSVDSQGYYNITINTVNTRKKYCYAVKKVDAVPSNL